MKYIYHYSVVRSIAEKGPSAEEKISSLEAVVSNYEAKVSGLEHEMETQREMYESKLAEFTKRWLHTSVGLITQSISDTLLIYNGVQVGGDRSGSEDSLG